MRTKLYTIELEEPYCDFIDKIADSAEPEKGVEFVIRKFILAGINNFIEFAKKESPELFK